MPEPQALVVMPHVVVPHEVQVLPHAVTLRVAVVNKTRQPFQAKDHAVMHAVVAQPIAHPKEGRHSLLALKQKVSDEVPP
ncbi:Cell division protein zipA [Yersinia intermedia ATCC 29909]|nr:Cell division protein zipA [Yersinia intermedia ATCC 29909]